MFIYVMQTKSEDHDWHDLDYPQYEPTNMYFSESEALSVCEWYRENLPEYEWRIEKRHYILNYVHGVCS